MIKRTPVIKFGDVPNGGLFSLWADYDDQSDGGVYVKLLEVVFVDAEDTDLEYNTFDVSDCVLCNIDDNVRVILLNEVEMIILK